MGPGVCAHYFWVCQISRTTQSTACIASIWAHHLSLWDLEAGERDDSSLCLRFKVSCFHPLSHHLWSGGTYGVVKALLLRSLWDWSSSLTCTFIKIKANCPSPQIYKDPRTFHHPLGTNMLKLKRGTPQGSQRNWGGCHGSRSNSMLWKCSVFIITLSHSWLGAEKMTPENQTHNWLKYNQGYNLFISSEKHNCYVHLKCVCCYDKTFSCHRQIYLRKHTAVIRWLGEDGIRTRGVG